MATSNRSRPPRRTLVVALGEQGLAIAGAFHRRLAERGQNSPFLATLAIVTREPGVHGTAGEAADGICIVSVAGETDASGDGQASHQATRRAMLAAGQPLVAALMEQLLRISRVQPAVHTWAAPLKVRPELDVVLIAALDDPLAGAGLLDVAYLARHLIHQRLNAAAQASGLLLLPHPDATLDVEAAAHRCRAALQALDRFMGPHDGFTTRWDDGQMQTGKQDPPVEPGGGLAVEGWGPPFDRGCFLLGALNAQSLTLGSADERNEFAAEILMHLAATGLASLCDGSAPPAWGLGERVQGYGGIGLASWVYPAGHLIEHVSRRMATEMLTTWLTPERGGEEAESGGWGAAAFWQHTGATAAALEEQTLHAADLDLHGLWRPLQQSVAWTTGHDLRQALDDQMAERLEGLVSLRPGLDQAAAELGRRLGEQLGQAIDQRLDQPTAGRLPQTKAFAVAAKEWLVQAQADSDARGDQHWRALEATEQELARVGRQLDQIVAAGHFPQPTWRSLLATLLRPGRLWRLAQAMPELQRLAAAYAALLLRQTAIALEVLQRDLATMVYDEVLATAGRQTARIAGLEQAAAAAMERLLPIPPAPCGALGFGLELSALTPERVEALYRQMRGALPDLLAGVAASSDRLSGWPGGDPDGEDMAGVYLAFAQARCAEPLRTLTVDQLVVDALPDTQARLEALAGLVESASPFLAWDETRLHSLEHDVLSSCAVLGLGEGAASLALADTSEVLFAQTAPTGDSQRVVALCAVQGLPLEALVGWPRD